jgi:ribosomal protein L44E
MSPVARWSQRGEAGSRRIKRPVGMLRTQGAKSIHLHLKCRKCRGGRLRPGGSHLG